jgi:hypothetical protein
MTGRFNLGSGCLELFKIWFELIFVNKFLNGSEDARLMIN